MDIEPLSGHLGDQIAKDDICVELIAGYEDYGTVFGQEIADEHGLRFGEVLVADARLY